MLQVRGNEAEQGGAEQQPAQKLAPSPPAGRTAASARRARGRRAADATSAKKIAAEAPETWPSAAKATEAAPQSRADPSRTDASPGRAQIRHACSRPAGNRFKLNGLRSSFPKWRMILLENRFPLFRIMLWDGGTAVSSRVAGVCATGPCACVGLSTRGRFQRSRRWQLRRPALVRQRDDHVH